MSGVLGVLKTKKRNMDMMNWSSLVVVGTLIAGCLCGTSTVGAQSINRVQVKDFAEELEVRYQLKTDRPLTVQLPVWVGHGRAGHSRMRIWVVGD